MEKENIDINDDDDLKLSESALKALQEFYDDQKKQEEFELNNKKLVEENWQLSQFWYDKETTDQLTKEVFKIAKDYLDKNPTKKFSIACVSCPTLYHNLYSIMSDSNNNNDSNEFYSKIEFKLFEFDSRFDKLYNRINEEENFIFYDYNKPLNIDQKYKNRFQLVIADPPYIAEECMIKTSMTIRYLLYNNDITTTNNDDNDDSRKIIVCTGQLMKDLLEKCLNLKQCINFEPKHERNLANEFRCYTNYKTYYL